MRRVYTVATIMMALLALAPAIASQGNANILVGTVVDVDESAQKMTVSDASGRQWSVEWNHATKFLTRPRVNLKMKITLERPPQSGSPLVAKRVGLAEKRSF